MPAPKRGEILFRFAQLLAEHKDELTELMAREMGKVKAEAGGDVQEAIDMSLLHGRRGPAAASARRRRPSCATSST